MPCRTSPQPSQGASELLGGKHATTPPFTRAHSFSRALYLPFLSTNGASVSRVTGVEQVERASTTKAFCPLNLAALTFGVFEYTFFTGCLRESLAYAEYACMGIHIKISISWHLYDLYSPSLTGNTFATFLGVVVITTTLTNTSAVPAIVRGPIASPPRKYPTSTATTGFTYA
jgi:hypothetical protein